MHRYLASTLAALVIPIALTCAAPAFAAKLSPIGVITIAGVGSMPIYSFSSGVTQSITGTVSSTGSYEGRRADFSSVSFMKPLDQYSPRLFIGAASGQHFPSAQLDVYGPGSSIAMSVILSDVMITSVHQGGTTIAAVTAEEVAIAFAKIELRYNGPNGATSSAWDLQANRRE